MKGFGLSFLFVFFLFCFVLFSFFYYYCNYFSFLIKKNPLLREDGK